jgi:hypothetical protein
VNNVTVFLLTLGADVLLELLDPVFTGLSVKELAFIL